MRWVLLALMVFLNTTAYANDLNTNPKKGQSLEELYPKAKLSYEEQQAFAEAILEKKLNLKDTLQELKQFDPYAIDEAYTNLFKKYTEEGLNYATYKEFYDLALGPFNREYLSLLIGYRIYENYPVEGGAYWEKYVLTNKAAAHSFFVKLQPLLIEESYDWLMGHLHHPKAEAMAQESFDKAISYLETSYPESDLLAKWREYSKLFANTIEYRKVLKPNPEVENGDVPEFRRFEVDKKLIHKFFEKSLSHQEATDIDLALASEWFDIFPQEAAKIFEKSGNDEAQTLIEFMKANELIENEPKAKVDYNDIASNGIPCAAWRVDAQTFIKMRYGYYRDNAHCPSTYINVWHIPEIINYINFYRDYDREDPDKYGCPCRGCQSPSLRAGFKASAIDYVAWAKPNEVARDENIGKQAEDLMTSLVADRPDWASYGLWNKKEYDSIFPRGLKAVQKLAELYQKTYGTDSSVAISAAYSVLHSYPVAPTRYLSNKNEPLTHLFEGSYEGFGIPTGSEGDMKNAQTYLRRAMLNDYPAIASKEIIKGIPEVLTKLYGERKKVDTPLQIAASYRPELIEFMLEHGAKVDEPNWFGKTPLMYAIQYQNLEAVKTLVEHGSDVNHKTFEIKKITENLGQTCNFHLQAGLRTPLMYAAWHGNPEIVLFLLGKGADKNLQDTNSKKAADYLEKNESLTSSEVLAMKRLLQ